MHDLIDTVNLGRMRTLDAVRHYSIRDDLSPPERASLDEVAAWARGKPVLDIGVGGGRTVKALLDVSTDYLGVDNSPEMIAACRRRFPGVRFELADARRMAGIADGSIALAVFSCNGIGMVSHADRIRILAEVQRVLQPGGVFLFSTHNRDCPDHVAGYKLPPFFWSANPARLAVRTWRFLARAGRRWQNRRRLVRHEVRASTYSIINDVCHDYGVMLYYISLAEQRRQLEALGFEPDATAYALDGRRIDRDCTDSSLTLIARKPRSAPQAGRAEPPLPTWAIGHHPLR